MRVVTVQLRNDLFSVRLQQIDSLDQKIIILHATAVILHRLGDRHIQFFPGDTFCTVHRCIQTFSLRIHFCLVDLSQFFDRITVICRFSSRIVSCRTCKSGTVGCKQLITGRIDTVNIGLQIPVMHDSARRTEQLSLLIQEGCGLPAIAIALQHMFLRIKSTFCIILKDRNLGLSFLSDHHAPDDFPLHLRHSAQIRIKRQFISPLDQFVKRHRLRSAVLVLRFIDHAAF